MMYLSIGVYLLLTTSGWCLMAGTESSTDATIPDTTRTGTSMASLPQSLGSGEQQEPNNMWMNVTMYPLYGPENESGLAPELVNTTGHQGTSDGFWDQEDKNGFGDQGISNGFVDPRIQNTTGGQRTSSGFGDQGTSGGFGDQGFLDGLIDQQFPNETGNHEHINESRDQGVTNKSGNHTDLKKSIHTLPEIVTGSGERSAGILHKPDNGNVTHGALNDTGNQNHNGTNTTDYYYYYDEDMERTLLSHSVWVTSGPGVVCNTIIIIVVKELKPFTTNSMFILVLGITDLINVLARIGTALVYFIAEMSDVTCKLFDFLILTSFNYSNAILVLWTVERFIAVWFPIKYVVFCTSRKTMVALLFTALVLCLLSIPYLLDAYAKTDEYGFVFCEYSEFLYETWTPIETAYYIWIPLGMIVTLNILIINRLVTGNRARLGKGLSSERAEQRSRDQRQMTRVLMAVSLSFLLLHLPQACVTLYLSLSGRLEEFLTDPDSPLHSLVWCFVFTEFQNSINFPLYCLTGRDFRAQCCKFVGGCKGGEDDGKQTGNTGTSSK